MKKEELEIIDQFINGFEPWQSNMQLQNHYAKKSKDDACFVCGIDPVQVKKLRDAVEKMRELVSL